MKLRIWHNSSFGKPPFTQEVPDIEVAIRLLDTLAYYDLYQGDRVVANAQGLEYFDEQEKDWNEWYNEDGEDIDAVREKVHEEANKIIESLKGEGSHPCLSENRAEPVEQKS